MLKILFKIEKLLILATIFCLPFHFFRFKHDWISLNLVEILVAVLFLLWVFSKGKKYLILNVRYLIPISLIFIGLILSIVANKNYYAGLGILKGWFFFPMLFAVVVADSLGKDKGLLKKIFSAMILSGLVVSAEGIYYWLNGIMTYDERLRIFYDSPNQLAMFLAPAFLVGLILSLGRLQMKMDEEKLDLWGKWIVAVGTLLIALNLYLTKSFGAWIAIGLVAVVIFWLGYRKVPIKKHLFFAIVITMIFVGIVGLFKFKDFRRLGDRSSLSSRIMIWNSALLMVEEKPLLGIGPGNFQEKYLEYQSHFSPYLEWAVPQPHNLYLAFWLESGLLGLFGFLWLLRIFFQENKKAIKNNRLYGTTCLAIIIYFLIHGLIDTTYWRNDMAFLFWIVVAMNYYLAEYPKST